MTTTQQKFMDKMEVVAHVYKYDLVVDKNYANTGHIRFQDPGSFEAVLDIAFDFQASADRVRFQGLPNCGDRWMGFMYTALDAVVNTITEAVKR